MPRFRLELPTEILLQVLHLLPLCKLRQLKSINKEWRKAARLTLTSTKWLFMGKSDQEVRKEVPHDEEGRPDYDGFLIPHVDPWSRLHEVARTLDGHTFRLPFHAMTWPGGVCFSDGFGSLEYRAITVHDLALTNGRITRMVVETKMGVFSTLKDIFEDVVCDKPLKDMFGDDRVQELKKEWENDRTSTILRNLLPCIKLGNAYVSQFDNMSRGGGTLTLMHALRPDYRGPESDDADEGIRTRFVLSTPP